jgi:hypothetical protein
MPQVISFFCEKFYNSPSVLDMPFKIRSLYKYTILNPSRSCSGVYTLPINKICFETGLNRKEVESCLKQLESKHNKIFYEFDTQQIFVFTIFKLMTKTKQIIISAQNDFKYNIVTDRILKKFMSIYPGYVDGQVMVTRPSITVCTDTVTDTVTVTDTNPPTPLGGNDAEYSPEFEGLWKIYPRKLEKTKTYKAYKARLNQGTKHEILLQAVRHYAELCRKAGKEQRHIKHPKTFLGPDRVWQDFVKGIPEGELPQEQHHGTSRKGTKKTSGRTKQAKPDW